MSQHAKLQRWMDLTAALLARRFGATFAELRTEVPGYAMGKDESVRRTFERDKDELRRLGVPITVAGTPGDESARYRVEPGQFYLPYLALAGERGLKRPRRVDRYGYHALRECAFTDEELALLGDAAARVRTLGDATLAADATRALAKLALDLPTESLAETPGVMVHVGRPQADHETLAQLGDALRRRKQVTFTYYGIERNETERRTVLPYGLAFTAGHWYLHGHDTARGAVRRFRVSRMRSVAVNPKSPGTQDFEIPAAFRLAQDAAPVAPWELGEDEATEAVVRFTRTTGAARVAAGVGRAAPDGTVRYLVRRRDRFLRWLLGLAGDAMPVAPPDVVREFQALAERTAAAHADGGGR